MKNYNILLLNKWFCQIMETSKRVIVNSMNNWGIRLNENRRISCDKYSENIFSCEIIRRNHGITKSPFFSACHTHFFFIRNIKFAFIYQLVLSSISKLMYILAVAQKKIGLTITIYFVLWLSKCACDSYVMIVLHMPKKSMIVSLQYKRTNKSYEGPHFKALLS